MNDQPIAFEFVGTHYTLKKLDEKENEKQMQGKKSIKYRIIEAYGIKIL